MSLFVHDPLTNTIQTFLQDFRVILKNFQNYSKILKKCFLSTAYTVKSPTDWNIPPFISQPGWNCVLDIIHTMLYLLKLFISRCNSNLNQTNVWLCIYIVWNFDKYTAANETVNDTASEAYIKPMKWSLHSTKLTSCIMSDYYFKKKHLFLYQVRICSLCEKTLI